MDELTDEEIELQDKVAQLPITTEWMYGLAKHLLTFPKSIYNSLSSTNVFLQRDSSIMQSCLLLIKLLHAADWKERENERMDLPVVSKW